MVWRVVALVAGVVLLHSGTLIASSSFAPHLGVPVAKAAMCEAMDHAYWPGGDDMLVVCPGSGDYTPRQLNIQRARDARLFSDEGPKHVELYLCEHTYRATTSAEDRVCKTRGGDMDGIGIILRWCAGVGLIVFALSRSQQ